MNTGWSEAHNRKTDRWTDRWMMDVWLGGWVKGGRMKEQTGGWMNRQKDEQMVNEMSGMCQVSPYVSG